MCGIAGVRTFDGTPITGDMVCSLLLGIEHRGKDATGVALMDQAGEIHIHKTDDPAWRFVNSKVTQEFLDEHLPTATQVLLHTRAATQGSPLQNENNHPVYAGNAAIVHNGVIHNEVSLYNEWKAEPKAEVDSDIFRAAFDHFGIGPKLYKKLGDVRGSAAVAAFTKEDPTKLFLMRSGSPIVLGATRSLLMWASTQQAIFKSYDEWVETHNLVLHRRGAPEMTWGVMPDDTGFVIGPGGKEQHFPFRTLMVTYQTPSYSRQESGYKERRKRWVDAQIEDAQKKETPTLAPVITMLPPGKVEMPGGGSLIQIPTTRAAFPATAVEEGFFARCPCCEGISQVPKWLAEKATCLGDLRCGNDECGANLALTDEQAEQWKKTDRDHRKLLPA